MSVAAPPKPPPPPLSAASPARPSIPPPGKTTSSRSFSVSRGVAIAGQRIVAYGPGGIGKTELCSLLKELGVEPLILDVENGSRYLDVARIADLASWQELRDVLHDEQLWKSFGAVVIDSLTKAEEFCVAHTLANVPHEKGHAIDRVEDYGFGKGYTHIYEMFLPILGDLDAHVRAGRHVICVCHECTATVPNPNGEDWLQYQPRLQSPTSGKASIRHRVKEWCDHLLFIGYDVNAGKDGKAKGSGTRTIYPVEMPTHWAKSRSLSQPVPYRKGDAQIWTQLLSNKGE